MKEWDRIEPHTRSEELEAGLQACTADAAWFLARQWQVGEFRGEDAASPIRARIEVGWAPLRTFRNPASRGPSEAISPEEPLEVRAEAMSVEAGPSAFALAAEAGLQFLRRLDAEGLEGLRSKCRTRFALDLGADLLLGLPPREQIRLRLLARRAPDGRKLAAAADAQIEALGTSATERAALGRVLLLWRTEQAQRFARPGASGETWIDERLEHRFSVAAATDGGEVAVTAPQYPGGRLDWYGFDLSRAGGAGARPLQTRTLELVPTPLAYAGMPAARWWEREEGSVYFGAIDASPADLGRLTLVEYATVYSNDWFSLPFRLPVGVLARVQRVRVSDTFGGAHQILPAAFLDAQRPSGARERRSWAFFELDGDTSPQRAVRRTPAGEVVSEDESQIAPWLLLPSVLSSAQSSRPVERVGFVRDEGANLAWAIESTIEGATGRPVQRRLQWGLAREASMRGSRSAAERERMDAPPIDGSEPWSYRLQTAVPPYWIPLAPEPVGTAGEMRLRRARMSQWDDIAETWVKGPKGQILAPSRPLRLFEEEVPRGGVEVSRRWQLARGSDGRLHLWMGREKRPGRGERASGLEQDVLLRRPERR